LHHFYNFPVVVVTLPIFETLASFVTSSIQWRHRISSAGTE